VQPPASPRSRRRPDDPPTKAGRSREILAFSRRHLARARRWISCSPRLQKPGGRSPISPGSRCRQASTAARGRRECTTPKGAISATRRGAEAAAKHLANNSVVRRREVKLSGEALPAYVVRRPGRLFCVGDQASPFPKKLYGRQTSFRLVTTWGARAILSRALRGRVWFNLSMRVTVVAGDPFGWSGCRRGSGAGEIFPIGRASGVRGAGMGFRLGADQAAPVLVSRRH